MATSIVRGKYVIARAKNRTEVELIEDGAVAQADGNILELGGFAALQRKYPDASVLGGADQVVLPGFVNGHHHVGLTPVQLGSPDMPLELWFATRLVTRPVDLYLDTLYSAFEMIASGITTVQHLHGWAPGDLAAVHGAAGQVIRAYEDIGMRVSYSFALRDQNMLVYEANEAFTARLPAALQPAMQRHFSRFQLTTRDHLALFEQLFRAHQGKERVRIQLAPANLHWCSDAALEQLQAASAKHGAPMHMHLVETAYQKEYARRRGGGTAVDYLQRFGMLGPHMTLGHGVWLNESDLEKIAGTGTHICHNCSSNLRLRSGVAALNHFEAKGINSCIGLDEAGINDDRDMLQEMRMVLRQHREPGMDDRVPTMAQVFRMATQGGARTTTFADRIGALEPGKAADLVLLDWKQIAYPYLDSEMPVLDAVIQRAKTHGVRLVMIAGEPVYQDGRFLKVDRDQVLKELAQHMARPLSDEDRERRALSKAVLPHVKAFYDRYFDPEQHQPFYRPSSRI
jgi:5-methylthioadenosine/S-adenosylhomocysteine deaminase